MNNTNEKYVAYLEESLREMIAMVVDPSLWNFLSDQERQKVSSVLQRQQEAH